MTNVLDKKNQTKLLTGYHKSSVICELPADKIIIFKHWKFIFDFSARKVEQSFAMQISGTCNVDIGLQCIIMFVS